VKYCYFVSLKLKNGNVGNAIIKTDAKIKKADDIRKIERTINECVESQVCILNYKLMRKSLW